MRENYLGFAKALPDTRVFYAVKANPAPGFELNGRSTPQDPRTAGFGFQLGREGARADRPAEAFAFANKSGQK